MVIYTFNSNTWEAKVDGPLWVQSVVTHVFIPKDWEAEADRPLWIQGVVAHTFNLNTWEAEASGSLWVQGQPVLQREFQDKDTQRTYLKKPKVKSKNKK